MIVRKLLMAVLIVLLFAASTYADQVDKDQGRLVRTIQVINDSSDIEKNIASILVSRIQERSNARFVNNAAELQIILKIKQGIGSEGFSITDTPSGAVEIIGNEERGLLYGVGKFLRTSSYDNGFVVSAWRGTSVPQCPVRGIYFAVHFNNFYEAAPAGKVERYLEDLALWGMNSIVFHFPPQQFNGFDDPAAKKNIEKIHDLMLTAKRLGIKVGLIECLNIGFMTAPKEYYYQPFPDDLHRRGNLGVLLCPSNPNCSDYLLKQWDQLTDELGVKPDFFISWPYDEGGCGCDKCWPWGSNGFLKISKQVCDMIKRKNPECKFILSTWMFDTPPAGEWEGLTKALKNQDWVDGIMADAHEDFPRYPLDNEIPGKLPLINFPEISMWGQGPWGGYGANPLPARFQRLWNQSSIKLSGGFPYSEGIYEDINKVICLQFYWNKARTAKDIVKEYISSQFSPEAVEKVTQAIDIMESNHHRDEITQSAEEAFKLICDVNKSLPEEVKRSWRWRILFLRAQIDYDLYLRNGKLSGSVLKNSFEELTNIYYAQQAYGSVKPPIVTE